MVVKGCASGIQRGEEEAGLVGVARCLGRARLTLEALELHAARVVSGRKVISFSRNKCFRPVFEFVFTSKCRYAQVVETDWRK